MFSYVLIYVWYRLLNVHTIHFDSEPVRLAIFVERNTGRDALKLLQNDVLPIFHLAGMNATVHKTYKSGQARAMMASLDMNIIDHVVTSLTSLLVLYSPLNLFSCSFTRPLLDV